MARAALLLLIAGVALVCTHTHSHEPAHYKYSKAANEAYDDHGHSHEHHGHSHDEHDHGHAHDVHDHGYDHGHAHEEHGHAHEHHGHAHESGECPYAKAAREERVAAAAAAAAKKKAAHGHSHSEQEFKGALSFLNNARTRLWVYAVGSTVLISIAPFLILFFIPLNSNTDENAPLLKTLLAFGSGGLLGDAFLHLIPHATPPGDGHGHSHAHGHSHGGEGHAHGPHDMFVGGWVLGGIITFLVVEKLVRILRGEDGHGHGHSHGKSKDKESDDEHEKKKNEDDKKDKKKCATEQKEENIKVAAYLNLVADFAHNFTDGLAIGASFLAGSTVGFVTMVTILFHEVPHEIGDFAILIQSGYTRRKAMGMQLVTAAGALSGCVISLIVADGSIADAASSSFILPFTAGGFIYIATVSVIPELLENSSFWQTVREVLAILVGIGFMYLIAMYE